ncbi:hypothetical protein TSAR_009571 [Trichomalopsis sarcophagae]|uniref:Saposin A-type domain-containing protein n=1 Tax=Trichomalopsis sarcophagae TaxID=543379 RepID=A0A232FDZ9_9HYME|nr:hypothetical protein TSAR_009571 [Trichomalopsis sarcophagae]
MRTLLLCVFGIILLNYFEQVCSHVIDDCTLGENYWCSSESNAKKCEKMDVCFPPTDKDDYIKMKPIAEVPPDPENISEGIKHNPFGGYIG